MPFYAVLGEFSRGNAANSLTLGELYRGCEYEGLVLGGTCTVLPQCVSLGATACDGCRGYLKEASQAEDEPVTHANLRAPLEAPHGHTQRTHKRPGPWPRALPATIEFR